VLSVHWYNSDNLNNLQLNSYSILTPEFDCSLSERVLTRLSVLHLFVLILLRPCRAGFGIAPFGLERLQLRFVAVQCHWCKFIAASFLIR
jgi:hypothetical protein